jgi:hypothetical protein
MSWAHRPLHVCQGGQSVLDGAGHLVCGQRPGCITDRCILSLTFPVCSHPHMDRRHGSPQTWQEARRQRAFERTPPGWKPCESAAALGVSPAAVSQWRAHTCEHGVEGWRPKPRPTGPINLTGDPWRVIPERLSHGAEAYGCRGACWTCAHVSRFVKRWHWTRRYPLSAPPHAMKRPSRRGVCRSGPSSTTGTRRRPDHRVGGRVRV